MKTLSTLPSPHCPVWDHREWRVERQHLLDEMLRHMQSGHNIVSTVFIERPTMFCDDGWDEMDASARWRSRMALGRWT